MDPLQQQNLHGIIKTLFKEYNKPTLLRFTKALLDLVSYEVSETVANTKPIEVLEYARENEAMEAIMFE